MHLAAARPDGKGLLRRIRSPIRKHNSHPNYTGQCSRVDFVRRKCTGLWRDEWYAGPNRTVGFRDHDDFGSARNIGFYKEFGNLGGCGRRRTMKRSTYAVGCGKP